MTNKLISSVLLASSVGMMALTPHNSGNLLFIFVSSNLAVAVGRLALALGIFWLSFRRPSLNKYLKNTFLGLGVITLFLGFNALLTTPLGTFLYGYLNILDILILMEVGITLTTVALLPVAPLPRIAKTPKLKQQNLALRQKTA